MFQFMINKLKYEGKYEIYKNGVLIDTIYNKVTNQFLNNLILALTSISPQAMNIKYLAVGNGSTEYDNKLGNEFFRVQYSTAPARTENVGEVKTEFILLPNEAIGNITEIGIFGGNATSTKDSGFMISRIPWNYEKTGSDEFIIVRTDLIRRG